MGVWKTKSYLEDFSFTITNGTRQGYVLPPVIFSVYLDDLLKELRRLQLGCNLGGCWYGACGIADELIILAPNREVLQRIQDVCADQNQVFSTDPVPARSKNKCIYFCGRLAMGGIS